METGYQSTFVISWSQTEVDGISEAPWSALRIGSRWSWVGEALSLNGLCEFRSLESTNRHSDPRKRAAYAVHKLASAAMEGADSLGSYEVEDALLNMGFEVTDGYESYIVSLIISSYGRPLLAFNELAPPPNTDLWVARAVKVPSQIDHLQKHPTGVLCFVPGTQVRVPGGETSIQSLKEGDMVLTRDNGVERVLWIGERKLSGMELFSSPGLRPIRIRASTIRSGQPSDDLVLRPRQQVLISGARAQEFNTEELALVSVCDLLDERRTVVDYSSRDVTYIHILLEDHQILWANGVPVESCHPANSEIGQVNTADFERLLSLYPEMRYDAAILDVFETSAPQVLDEEYASSDVA